MSITERIRKAWASFMSSFDYEPPRALAVTEPADTEIMEPQHPPDVQAALNRISTATAEELPNVMTRVTQRSDGTWHQTVETKDGELRELTVIERAIIDRADVLRRQASG